MNVPTIALLTCACMLVPQLCGAQAPLKKGDIVTLLVPLRIIQDDSDGTEARLNIARVTVTKGSDGALAIEGNSNWRKSGLPLMKRATINNVSDKKNERFVSIGWEEFSVIIDVTPPATLTDIVNRLVLPGEPTSPAAIAYENETLTLLGDAFFSPVPSVQEGDRAALLTLAKAVGAQRLGVERFRDREHLVLDLGRTPMVANTIRLNEAARTAEVVRKYVLPALRLAVKHKLPDAIGDLKVLITVRSMSALQEFGRPNVETVSFFAPIAEVRRFVNAETTNQQLVDACVVLLNEDRVQVNLAGG